jgi:hypothetical protein
MPLQPGQAMEKKVVPSPIKHTKLIAPETVTVFVGAGIV